MSLHLDSRYTQLLYTNIPILRGLRSIRLLRVEPGPWSQPISCHLHELFLERAPTYKALSYAWANGNLESEPMGDSIWCNGIPIRVSANLYSALLQLRDSEMPVELWVDSICINQKDVLERSDQVRLMRDIYQNSSEVIIWLGGRAEHDDLGGQPPPSGLAGSEMAAEEDVPACVHWYGDGRDNDKWKTFIKGQQSRQHLFDAQARDVFGAFCVIWLLSVGIKASHIIHLRHITQSAAIINGLRAIMDQSWWRRTWVVQETIVANKATVYYSNISAPWTMFADAAVAYEKTRLLTSVESVYPYPQPLMQFARIITEMESTRQVWNDPLRMTTLLPLLRMFRPRLATDARDKVFALLGLVQWWGGGLPKLLPDYNMSAERVFWQTTITLIKNTRSLSVLAGTLRRGLGHARPSWVTDWSCSPDTHENIRLSNLRHYNAAKSAAVGAARVHGQSLLEIHGFKFDEVESVRSVLPLAEEGETSRWRLVVSEWERCLGLLGTEDYVGGGTVASAFWRTLCGDIQHLKDPENGRAEFRRSTDLQSSTYAKWRCLDTGRKRRTSIIAGYWQESGGPTDPDPDPDSAPDADIDTATRNAFHYGVECASGCRRFFITRKGYIGTGPAEIAAGDKIYIVSGCPAPFILRETSASYCRRETLETLIEKPLTTLEFGANNKVCNDVHTHCFTVVGDAYVHGIMDGQAGSLLESETEPITGPIFLL